MNVHVIVISSGPGYVPGPVTQWDQVGPARSLGHLLCQQPPDRLILFRSRSINPENMPLELGGYSAHVSCGGKELEAYDVTDENGTTVSCWIASEEGQVSCFLLG